MRGLLAVLLGTLPISCGIRPPDGRAELEASRRAMLGVTRFTIEVVSTTTLQTRHSTYHVDCGQGYYYNRKVVDLTPEGIEKGTTRLQGRPRAHRESEELHVGGRSYERYSGHWEGPLDPQVSDREKPEWAPTRSDISFAEKADCGRIRQEADLLGVPYSKMARATAVAFVGRQRVGPASCNEFRFTYVDTVYGDRMIEHQSGGGWSGSSRELVRRPLEARLCIGVADKLAYRAQQVDVTQVPETRQFSYGEFERLDAPAPTP